MQILIDIDENLYTRLFDNGDEYVADMRRACVSIRKGILLPKGHGRLIDADVFLEMLNNMPVNYEDKWFNWMQKESLRLASVPTIIEADKESEEQE